MARIPGEQQPAAGGDEELPGQLPAGRGDWSDQQRNRARSSADLSNSGQLRSRPGSSSQSREGSALRRVGP